MKSIQLAAIAAAAFLGTAVYAGDVQSFSALQGVEAQAMSSPEMSSVYGQLDVPGLHAAIDVRLAANPTPRLTRLDAAVDNHPRLAQAIVNVVNARNN